MVLRHIDAINAMIADLDQRITTEIEPYRREVELLDTVPGIAERGPGHHRRDRYQHETGSPPPGT